MLNSRTSLASLFLVSLIICSEVAAHSTPKLCATFYTEKNKKGSKVIICNQDPLEKCNLTGEFANAVSSIYVPYGYNVRLFKEPNKKGEWMDIQAGTWNAPAGWDNVIASVNVVNFGQCSTFYKEPNQQGESKLICDSTTLPAGWNNAVSSVKVAPWHSMRIYKKGASEWLDIRGKWTAPADWDKKLYSFTFKHWDVCFWIYKQAKLKGERFYVCDNISTMPAGWNDAIVSLRVPSNTSVTMFKDANFKGESIVLQAGVWNAPAGWIGQISSLQYTRFFHL